MPFKHSDELHHQVLNSTEFETDESYEMESEEEDRFNAECIGKQNNILSTMERTITKLSKALNPQEGLSFSLADALKRGIQRRHEDLPGLEAGYEITRDDDEPKTGGAKISQNSDFLSLVEGSIQVGESEKK